MDRTRGRRFRGRERACRAASLVVMLAVAQLTPSSNAWALDPERLLSQYGHVAWRLRDGELPAPAYPIAQTRDGYLWIGTQAGVLRFDGVRFTPLDRLSTTPLPAKFITALHGVRDGSLWIASTQGLSHWHGNVLTTIPGMGAPSSLLEDRSGTIWATIEGNRDGSRHLSLCSVEADSARCFAREDGIVFSHGEVGAGSLYEDAAGAFWFATEWSVARWRKGTQAQVLPVPAKIEAATPGRIVFAMAGGTPWVGVDARGQGLGLQRVEGDAVKPVEVPLRGSEVSVQALFADRAGVLWVGTLDDGIYRIRGDKVDHIRAVDGLSSDCIYWFFEDAAGDLWVSTSEGVDRFRDLPVSTFSKREGRSSDEADSVLATRDGRVWAGSSNALDILDHGVFTSYKAGAGLPGHQVTSMLEDHVGQVWIGIDAGLTVFDDGRFTPVNAADGQPMGPIASLAEDRQGNVWARFQKKLVRIRDRRVQEEFAVGAATLTADRIAGVWAASADGALAHFHDGTVDRFTLARKAHRMRQAVTSGSGALLFATDAGVFGWHDGRQRVLGAQNGLPCEFSTELAFDDAGDLWVFTECGLLRIAAADLDRWWADGSTVVTPRVLDALDGVRVGRPAFRALSLAPDGRLWLGNSVNLQMLDPAELRRTPAPAMQVLIENTGADRRDFGSGLDIALPPNPREVRIDYTAAGLGVPQRARFRYRLEGRDDDWNEAGARRQAFYSDLPPATYRFRVAASSDGVSWTEAEPLSLRVDATWHQMPQVRLLGVLAGMAILAALYRMRVRRVATALKARFDERLAERTRLARELHDTLLQTIQSSKMVADDALDHVDDKERMAHAMGRLSEWLGAAVREGREALHTLRASTTQTNDLAASLRRAADECCARAGMQLRFEVLGAPREMHPIVRDEIYRIGYEAIRNACAHSRGTQLDVGLAYPGDLRIVVRDDGIGFDPVSRPGHFGVEGMRERAARIGAQLRIERAAAVGTEVTLVVPAAAAYRGSGARPRGLRGRWRRLRGRDARHE
ncbi:two component regulator with propeller domain [Dokdonella fugitiva]|uniref:Two component regulator with propeller domain n=2 Tax=Dokdonella fugitiva TaxID=328517 RepID=A0A4R2I2G1_9GAMM|nr:two component regulator with propeller domain [Dokdonella fugitiva]